MLGAGPAISVSFVLVAIACGFAAICYAELASMIPIAGSAYTYSYATLGEIFAWIIGWDLILEYAFSNMSVAVGFSAYFNDLLDNLFHFHLPLQLSQPIFEEGQRTGAWFNLPALHRAHAAELRSWCAESAKAPRPTTPWWSSRWSPFCCSSLAPRMPSTPPTGIRSCRMVTPASFRAAPSSSSPISDSIRSPPPPKNADARSATCPSGIFATLAICALLYGSVALVLTGIANWSTLNNDAPVANALKMIGMNRLRLIVTAGALLGMLSSLLVFQYGQARIWFAMSRDRLLPGVFSRVHPRYSTPYISTWVAGFVVGIPAGIFDISWFADLSNIGTLFAFILVSAGVIVLRRKQPNARAAFAFPGSRCCRGSPSSAAWC